MMQVISKQASQLLNYHRWTIKCQLISLLLIFSHHFSPMCELLLGVGLWTVPVWIQYLIFTIDAENVVDGVQDHPTEDDKVGEKGHDSQRQETSSFTVIAE